MLFIIPLVGLAFIVGCGKKTPDANDHRHDKVFMYHRLRQKVQTLDPAQIGDVISHDVGSEFFECLYDYHYLKRPYEVIPRLATNLPVISDDGLTYTISIRQDVFFHDDACFPDGKGRKLTAYDFVFAWKRIANVKTGSKNWWIFDNKILGLDEFREYSKGCERGQVDYDRPVVGLVATDDFTLEVRLKRPWPQFIFWLMYPATAPMAKEAVDMYGRSIASHPVGTGPFMMTEWRRGSYVKAVKNPAYHDDFYPTEGMEGDAEKGLLDDAGKKLPLTDGIVWKIISEDQPRWLLFMQGEIDINGIPKDNFGQAVGVGKELTPEMVARNIVLEDFDEPGTFWVGYNMKDPMFADNKPLRYALSYAIDRDTYIDLMHNGRGRVSHGFIPPVMPNYDPDIKTVSKSYLDLEKAKEYLQQAEAIHGGPIPRLRLALGGTDTTFRQMGQYFQRNFAQIGIDVEIELYDWPTYLDKLKKGEHQLFMSGWIADYPDTENFLQVYYSKNAPWPNSTNYANPEFDAIYEKVAKMADCPQRRELYKQAQRIVVEDLPAAFLFHRITYILKHNWMGNVKPNAYKYETNGMGLAKYWKVDVEKRKAYKETFK